MKDVGFGLAYCHSRLKVCGSYYHGKDSLKLSEAPFWTPKFQFFNKDVSNLFLQLTLKNLKMPSFVNDVNNVGIKQCK